jgi:hypothetical protein
MYLGGGLLKELFGVFFLSQIMLRHPLLLIHRIRKGLEM